MDMIEQAEHYSQQFDQLGRCRLESDRSMGCNRIARIHGDLVFKIARSDNVTIQCRSEWEFYTSTTDEIREHLCKPLYLSQNGRVIVMEKIVPCDESDRRSLETIEEVQDKLQDMMSEKAFEILMVDTQYNNFNWGWRGDDIVLMDYGALGCYTFDDASLDMKLRLRMNMGILAISE